MAGKEQFRIPLRSGIPILILFFRFSAVIFWPAGLQISPQRILLAVFLRLVELDSLQFIRHEFKIGEMSRIVMGIFVSVAVSELFHELRGSVSEI